MKSPVLVVLTVLAMLQACAVPDARSVAYALAVDVEKGECRNLSEPLRSSCLEDLHRRVEEQEDLAAELAQDRALRGNRQTPREDSLRARLEQAADDNSPKQPG